MLITPELDRELRRRWPDGRLPDGLLIAEAASDSQELSKQFRRIARRAAVRGNGRDGFCVLHDLRRNFGSRWAGKAPAQVLQRMMRHASINTTLEFYADVEQAALRLLWPEPAAPAKAARRGRGVKDGVKAGRARSQGRRKASS